jgi:hypothetical protein
MDTNDKYWKDLQSINDNLERGSIVKHKSDKHGEKAYVVDVNYGTRATAVKLALITEAKEWQVFCTETHSYSDIQSINEIKMGGIVKNKWNGAVFLVHHWNKDYAIGVDTVDITNPIEWMVSTL